MHYHVSEKDWNVGAVITPGNFGNQIIYASQPSLKITGTEVEVGPWVRNLMWEAALEASRVVSAPNAPGRGSIVFLSETLDLARRFRDKMPAGKKIYRTSPADHGARSHRGDFAVFENVPEPLFSVMAERCHLYWTNTTPAIPELLWEGDVIVEELIE